jgi:hypothetical protein
LKAENESQSSTAATDESLSLETVATESAIITSVLWTPATGTPLFQISPTASLDLTVYTENTSTSTTKPPTTTVTSTTMSPTTTTTLVFNLQFVSREIFGLFYLLLQAPHECQKFLKPLQKNVNIKPRPCILWEYEN